MPYHYAYHRPPSIYAETLARQHADALRAAGRSARTSQSQITSAIEQHGERMSEEGRGLLTGLAETLRGVVGAIGGRGGRAS